MLRCGGSNCGECERAAGLTASSTGLAGDLDAPMPRVSLSTRETRASVRCCRTWGGNCPRAAGDVARDARIAVAMSAESAFADAVSEASENSRLIDWPEWLRSAVVASDLCSLMRMECRVWISGELEVKSCRKGLHITPGTSPRGDLESSPALPVSAALLDADDTNRRSVDPRLKPSNSDGSACVDNSSCLRQLWDVVVMSAYRKEDLPGEPWLRTAGARAGELSAHSLSDPDSIGTISMAEHLQKKRQIFTSTIPRCKISLYGSGLYMPRTWPKNAISQLHLKPSRVTGIASRRS